MIKNLINGKWVESPETFETVNPATGEVLAEVAHATPEQVAAATQAAKDAFPAWANMPIAKRSKIIEKLGDLIGQHPAEGGRQ